MGRTNIEWTDKSWNPVTGCTAVSEGCDNCYAKVMSKRFPNWNDFKVTLYPERLDEPFGWIKAQKIFICSMADLFHEDVPFKFINKVFGVMHACENHTFQILTKRPERMREYIIGHSRLHKKPLKNLWLGVTAENQQRADERIPLLFDIPAAVRFVSVEPMLGPVDLQDYNELDWVICGGETGAGSRTMEPEWVLSLQKQCKTYHIPFFFKSWGGVRKNKSSSVLFGKEQKEFPS